MKDDDLISRMCVVNAIDIYILSKGHDKEEGRALQRLMAMIMHLPSHGGWHSADEEPTAEHTTEYIVRDSAGVISGRLYHPGSGWGKPGRAPSEEVAEWKEI